MTGFLLTQDEIGLFSVSAVFGVAFGGLIPGYILAVREIFPAAEAIIPGAFRLSCFPAPSAWQRADGWRG
jgi:hypothetical protein